MSNRIRRSVNFCNYSLTLLIAFVLVSCVCDRMDCRLIVTNKLNRSIYVARSEVCDTGTINTYIRIFNSELETSRTHPYIVISNIIENEKQQQICLHPVFIEDKVGLFIFTYYVDSLIKCHDQRIEAKRGIDYEIFYYSRDELEKNNWNIQLVE
jgi:hypothetical protein